MATNMNVSMRYSTFLPMLLEAVNRTEGDVLELGAGVFSTPVLHWLCEKQKRNLLTIESDRGWFRFTRQYLKSQYHNFLWVKKWDDAEVAINKKWDVVLIDHSPSVRRITEIKKLAKLAKYIIVHDSDPWKEKEYRYSLVYPLFKYRYNFTLADHQTAVLSNFYKVNDFWENKMKNLLIYINPKDKKFSKEHSDLTKMQIDNTLGLGWKLEDIILVTNFPYEYRGVKSIVVDSYSVFDQDRSTKIPAIIELFKRALIEDDFVYWFHDHDAFQLLPFAIQINKDAGFTDHGVVSKKWNAGSFFFKKSAGDIFEQIWETMNKRTTNEQDALTYMWENFENLNSRFDKINIAYNLGIYKIPQNLAISELPVKVAHFHPHKKRHLDRFRNILPKHLMKIFNNYGIK